MKKIILLLVFVMVLQSVFVSCSKDNYETVMEYNGIELKENMYNYWVSTYKKNILSSYEDVKDTEAFWKSKYDDTRTVEDYFTEIINKRIMTYLIAQSIFKENKLKLSPEVKSAIDADISEKIEYYGSRSALNSELKNLMLNINSLEKIYTWEEKHKVVYDYLFGEDGIEAISGKELEEYYKSNYSRIKYIVFFTTKIKKDDDGNYVYDSNGELVTEDMTEAELAAKKAEIEDCYDKLMNGASFEDMRKEYSEYDTSKYPNGFFLSKNELQTWGAEIILGTTKANEGEIFKVTEEEAVYIIMKCKLTELEDLNESDINQLSNLSVYATRELSEKKFEELSKDIVINKEIISKYALSTIKPNPYYTF